MALLPSYLTSNLPLCGNSGMTEKGKFFLFYDNMKLLKNLNVFDQIPSYAGILTFCFNHLHI